MFCFATKRAFNLRKQVIERKGNVKGKGLRKRPPCRASKLLSGEVRNKWPQVTLCMDRKGHTILSKNGPSLFDPQCGLLGFVWPGPRVGFGFPYDHTLKLGPTHFNLLDLISVHYFIYIFTYLFHPYFCSSTCLQIYSLFTNVFCFFWKFTENSKKKQFHTSSTCCLISHFGMNKTISCIYVFVYMHVLNFMFWVCMICVNNEFGIINGLGLLFYDLPKKGSVKILARSSISPEFQTKANFKVTASR